MKSYNARSTITAGGPAQKITISVDTGFDKLFKRLDEWAARVLSEEIMAALERAGVRFLQGMLPEWPVWSGRSASAWTPFLDEMGEFYAISPDPKAPTRVAEGYKQGKFRRSFGKTEIALTLYNQAQEDNFYYPVELIEYHGTEKHPDSKGIVRRHAREIPRLMSEEFSKIKGP